MNDACRCTAGFTWVSEPSENWIYSSKARWYFIVLSVFCITLAPSAQICNKIIENWSTHCCLLFGDSETETFRQFVTGVLWDLTTHQPNTHTHTHSSHLRPYTLYIWTRTHAVNMEHDNFVECVHFDFVNLWEKHVHEGMGKRGFRFRCEHRVLHTIDLQRKIK